MKNKFSISSVAALIAASFGGSFSARESRPRTVTLSKPSAGFNGQKKSRQRRRKNPMRGTTYAAHFGVSSHV